MARILKVRRIHTILLSKNNKEGNNDQLLVHRFVKVKDLVSYNRIVDTSTKSKTNDQS